MDFSGVFSELSSCSNQDELKSFLVENKFTFKQYPAKQAVDGELVDMDNQFVYVIKHPYQQDESTPVDVPPINDNLNLLHQFGRGIVIRVNFTSQPVEFNLMGLPLPFGQEDFIGKFDITKVKVTTLVDGTGFNVCKDPVSNLLFVSTRACGGYYPDGPLNYFGNRDYNYGTMFQEALVEHNMVDTMTSLSKGISLHFVMTHPADTKVYPVNKATLHLINVFTIDNNIVNYQDVCKFQLEHKTNFMSPVELSVNSQKSFDDMLVHADPKITAGFKLFDPTTHAWSRRILTKSYERIKELLGNDTNILFTLIRLRHQAGQYKKSMHGKPMPENYKSVVREFLDYFKGIPDVKYDDLYTSLIDTCKEATGELFSAYLQVYTNRDNDMSIFDKRQMINNEFRDLVKEIHEKYLYKRNEYEKLIKESDSKQTLPKPRTSHHDVMTYFNGLPPARIYDRLRQFSIRRKTLQDIFQQEKTDDIEPVLEDNIVYEIDMSTVTINVSEDDCNQCNSDFIEVIDET